MRLISLDQSTRVTGWSLFIDGQIVDSGVIDKHKINDSFTRMGEMVCEICDKINELNPDICVIEDIQNQSSAKTVIMLARLQGAILNYCYSNDIRTEILTPSQWRSKLQFHQGAGVKREELKQQAVDYVEKQLGIEDIDVDQAEAICISIAASKIFDDEI